jgi:hypothetical protein
LRDSISQSPNLQLQNTEIVVEHMKHTLFPTIEAMLSPETLSNFTGQPVTAVQQIPLTTDYGKSGSRIIFIETNEGKGPKFVLKRVSPDWDWLMRATEDTQCRSVTLWQYGIYDSLPPEIVHSVVSCARDGAGWAILMQDVGTTMLPYAPFTVEDNAFFLETMAAMHARFWQDPALADPALGLCRLHHYYSMFSPHSASSEAYGDNDIPRRILEGWALAWTHVPRGAAKVLRKLLKDPAPLQHALRRCPSTLVHGDWRHANQGYDAVAKQIVLLDWQLAMFAPPAVDLARYLITNSALLPITKKEAIAIYREELAARLGDKFDEAWWQPQLALSLLGGFIQDGWALVLKATHWPVGANARAHWRSDLDWWAKQVRAGAAWLK